MKLQKQNKGITLIALVITIIVLLILAGIVISLTIGKSGIVNKSKSAGKTYELSSIKEQIQMEILGKIDNNLSILENNIIEILEKYAGENGQVIYEEEKSVGVNPDQYPDDTIWLKDIWNGATVEENDETGFDTVKGVNLPQETDDMTPIMWDSRNTETTVTNANDWYDYSNRKWANAKTEDGSYWVWIPRFAYKITGQTIDIKFLKGTTNKTADGSEVTNDYIIHPAFQDGRSKNFINGEWKKEITGIWVAKFEMAREDSSDSGENWSQITQAGNVVTVKSESNQIRAVSKPGISSWGSINISNCYTNSFEYDRSKESHLMKNSEWGAVAYLTQSSCGRNGAEITINNNGETYYCRRRHRRSICNNKYKSEFDRKPKWNI